VVGLELVRADGSVLRCSADERPDLFAAARVGLGALGVISSVTLACESAFALSARETPMRLDDVLATLDELVNANEHVDLYWFPYTDRMLVKANNRVEPGSPLRPLGTVRRWFDDELMNNGVYEVANRLMSRIPRLAPTVNAIAAKAWSGREYVDRSYAVFTAPRRVVFREMEYAVPREAFPAALDEVRQWIERSDERIAFPLELRFSAPDDAWLSPAYERESGYIAVHQYHRMPHEPYFRAVEEIMRAVGGRPHWGKLHWRTASELRELYPRFDDFLRVRAECDPDGSFGNPYLERVLGS
jgi:L-gulonolactone oxidase